MNALPSHTYPHALHGYPDDDGFADAVEAVRIDPREMDDLYGMHATGADWLALVELACILTTLGLPRMDKADPRDVALVDRLDTLIDTIDERMRAIAEACVEAERKAWVDGL